MEGFQINYTDLSDVSDKLYGCSGNISEKLKI